MSKRVFITGGTGFIGKALVEALHARGDRVIALSRSPAAARAQLSERAEILGGDPCFAGDWQAHIRGVDAVIHLAGASVAEKRWNAQYKQIIHDSRVESTRYLVEAIQAAPEGERPAVFVCASGIDYYPFDVDLGAALAVDEDDEVTEATPPGSTFLARVCRNWEAEAQRAEALGVRVVTMRTGVVLESGKGGPFDKMAQPFRFFVGGRIGSGKQWFSWIHRKDAVRAYLFALDTDTVRGPLNLVAPGVVRSGEFAKAVGKALHRPALLPVPALAIQAALGEFAEHVLHGRRAVPAALQAQGFTFAYPELEGALADIVAKDTGNTR